MSMWAEFIIPLNRSPEIMIQKDYIGSSFLIVTDSLKFKTSDGKFDRHVVNSNYNSWYQLRFTRSTSGSLIVQCESKTISLFTFL